MDIKEILKELCAADGNSGDETSAAYLGVRLLSEYGKTRLDNLGNVICEIAPEKNGRTVMLDAHIDQIALIVTDIDENGFVTAMPCGGIDRRSICGTRVRVKGKAGEYFGTVCLPMGENKDNPKREDITLDLGFTKDEAEKRVAPGDRAMLCGKWSDIGSYVSSPALDDRSGCASIIYALDLLKGKELPCGLTAVFSTREEVGGDGAAAAAFAVAPTEALEMDVSFGKTPDTDNIETKLMKKGPMVGFGPTLDKRMGETLIELAKKNDIPYQYEVMSGSTGTNADDIAGAGCGVRAVTISLPQQYMHTTIEKMAIEDVENTGRLIAAYVMEGGCA